MPKNFPPSPASPDVFDVESLAAYLGISVHALYMHRHRGDFPPAWRVGRELRWRRCDVEQWIADRLESAEKAV